MAWTRHIFLLIGLGALAYFFLVDLETLRPWVIDYAVFIVGFVATLIYVVQSFMRFRRQRTLDGHEPPQS